MHINFQTLQELIVKRRSRQPATYTQQDIPKELLAQLFECARFAPTHKKTQPWKYQVYKNEHKRALAEEFMRIYQEITPSEKYSEAKREEFGAKIQKANCVVAIILNTHPELLPEWEEVAAVACSVQNLWLACTAQGIGAYWSSPGIIKHLNPFLELDENQKCIGLFYMGYSEVELPEWPRRAVDEFVTWKV